MIEILLNGSVRAIPGGLTLPALLEELGLPAQAVLIEHNGAALLRSDWPGIHLVTGDRLEIIRIVAGG